jgi:crossover junction endodeoxyribonuclease RuvC
MGYGVIHTDYETTSVICFGSLDSPRDATMGKRLSFLYNKLAVIISRYNPEVVAVEQPFVARNVKSTLALGKAQAVVLLAAANRGIPTFEYTPTQIKQRVTSYGTSPKAQIQEMVRLLLDLEEIPKPDDAADALAVALCHLQELQVTRLTGEE